MERLLTISLESTKRGRRIGWLRAQTKAAQLVLNAGLSTEDGLRLYRLIMALEDK